MNYFKGGKKLYLNPQLFLSSLFIVVSFYIDEVHFKHILSLFAWQIYTFFLWIDVQIFVNFLYKSAVNTNFEMNDLTNSLTTK